MALDFSNAKILTYSQKNDFWGEAFRYASKKELSIEGCIYALDNADGVAPIWSGINGFVENAADYDAIILNGINFGSGHLNSINFREGNDVRLKNYEAAITVYDTGNLFNLNGTYYTGLDLNNPNNPVYLTDNFSETFEFSTKDDGNHSYKQTVTVKFISGKMAGNSRSAIDMAKTLASGLLFSHPPFEFYNDSGRRTYTENYNLISNECSFSENFEIDTPSGIYSIRFSHECNTDQNGITVVTENGKIKGLVPDYFQSAESGYIVEAGHAYDRCEDVMLFYVTSGYPLSTTHSTSRKTINTIVGEIDYSIAFTNDPRFNINYIWDYTELIEREPNTCFYHVTENGHIQGRDNNCTYTQRDTNAINAYNDIITGISGRVTNYYTSGTSGLHNPLKLISKNKRHNPFLGTIDYSVTFADNLYYGISPGIKKVDYEIEDNQPVLKYNKFGVLNVGEIVQSGGIYTPGSQTCNVKIQGERGASFATCLNAANVIITSGKPTGIYFIDKATITFNPNQSNLTATIGWEYFQND